MTIFEALKLYREANKISKGVTKVKAGFKTSEFVMALVGAILPVLNEQLGWQIPQESVLSIAGIVIAYIASRTVVKRNGGTKLPEPPLTQ
jgi:hypothetical protein